MKLPSQKHKTTTASFGGLEIKLREITVQEVEFAIALEHGSVGVEAVDAAINILASCMVEVEDSFEDRVSWLKSLSVGSTQDLVDAARDIIEMTDMPEESVKKAKRKAKKKGVKKSKN